MRARYGLLVQDGDKYPMSATHMNGLEQADVTLLVNDGFNGLNHGSRVTLRWLVGNGISLIWESFLTSACPRTHAK